MVPAISYFPISFREQLTMCSRVPHFLAELACQCVCYDQDSWALEQVTWTNWMETWCVMVQLSIALSSWACMVRHAPICTRQPCLARATILLYLILNQLMFLLCSIITWFGTIVQTAMLSSKLLICSHASDLLSISCAYHFFPAHRWHLAIVTITSEESPSWCIMDLLTKSRPTLPLIGWLYWLPCLCLTQIVSTLTLVMSLFGSL